MYSKYPRIDKELVLQYHEGLIATTCCLGVLKDGRREGFEFKYSDRPAITKSMRIALSDLRLDKLTVVHPGTGRFPLDKKIEAAGLEAFSAPQRSRRTR